MGSFPDDETDYFVELSSKSRMHSVLLYIPHAVYAFMEGGAYV
jgi:hypothetical protein